MNTLNKIVRSLLSLVLMYSLFLIAGTGCEDDQPIENTPSPPTPEPSPLSIVGGGQSTNFNFYHFTPKVITPETGDEVILEIHNFSLASSTPVLETIWGLSVRLYDNGTNADKVANDNVFTCRLSKQSILNVNDGSWLNRPLVGTISLGNGRLSVFAEVWNATIPEVSVTKIADNMQHTTRVLNIATGSTISPENRAEYIKQFYTHFDDDYDFVSVIFPGFNLNRNYRSISQSDLGIGLPVFDYTNDYGSAGRMLGITEYPNTTYYDGASVAYQHELGHRWINFLQETPLKTGIPHWPLSDLANSIMGYSPGGGQGLQFPFDLVKQSENSWLLQTQSQPPVFNDLELYLMGLIPPNEVQPHIIFNNTTQTIQPGATLTGPVTTITIADIVNVYGERIPSVENSPKQFKIATILVTHTLLSTKEMSFYEHYTKRSEATDLVQVAEGYARYTSSPFYRSTGNRATLNTRIDD